MSRLRVVVLVAAAVVVLDQLTKEWALDALADGEIIEVVGSLQFNLVFNTGLAFSTGEGLGRVQAVIAVFASVGILAYATQVPSLAVRAGLGVVMGGALGNFVDRIARADDGIASGAVVDFIDLQWWPVFNIADMALTLGVIWLLVVLARMPEESGPDFEGGSGPDEDAAADEVDESAQDAASPAVDDDAETDPELADGDAADHEVAESDEHGASPS